ncbi:hypothetical protein C8Q80DRAFT_730780 [Daedaleopsis nitida]|nr:hypothetical protein C8Q80DRAFT_730780 [Daedaleopsis nitida]
MQRKTPLDGHPELTVVEHPAWTEYRVDATGRSASATRIPPLGPLWLHLSLVLVLAYCWDTVASSAARIAALALAILAYLYSRLTQVQWESVVILPSLGVQLETHRGFAGLSLLAACKFVPWSSLDDFLINEGIRGWDIRYYLVAINRTPQGPIQLEVAFENILPRFPVLLEVYHGVQEALRHQTGHKHADENESEHGSNT